MVKSRKLSAKENVTPCTVREFISSLSPYKIAKIYSSDFLTTFYDNGLWFIPQQVRFLAGSFWTSRSPHETFLQYVMGHSDAQITMNVYNHIAEKSHVENEMSKMNLPETIPAVV